MVNSKAIYMRVKQMYEQYISKPLAFLMTFGGYGRVEERASGSWVTDHKGERWLDCCSCYGALSLGHLHPKVVGAVIAQLGKMALSSKVFFSLPQALLAEQLATITPGKLQFSFFCNSGAEAVEAALKAARAARPGRPQLIAADNSFHGKLGLSLSVTGRPAYRAPFEPLIPDVLFVPFGDIECLAQMITHNVAALILEVVQGEGGIHVAPPGYLEAAQKLCQQHGVILIIDEVQTGLGRTGALFACNHFGIAPDILVLAKALGGGIMPIGACIMTKEVYQSAYGTQPTLHTSTFGGNPLACTAALATLEVLDQEQMPKQARTSGMYLFTSVQALAEEYTDLIAEVRGLGLLIGIELREECFAGKLITEMALRRIIAVYTLNQPRVIRLEPPLNISRSELDLVCTALGESLAATRQKLPTPY